MYDNETLKYARALQEINNVFLGEHIGEGAYRNVYSCKVRDDIVIKKEKQSGNFANIMEWKVWYEVIGTPFEKWFAPCINISIDGDVLLQKKVQPLRDSELPEKIPHFFSDIKKENFGLLDGKFVCCDYGSLIITKKWSEKQMRKPRWGDLLTR